MSLYADLVGFMLEFIGCVRFSNSYNLCEDLRSFSTSTTLFLGPDAILTAESSYFGAQRFVELEMGLFSPDHQFYTKTFCPL